MSEEEVTVVETKHIAQATYVDGNGNVVTEPVEYISVKTYRPDGSFDNKLIVPRLKTRGKSQGD